MTALHVVTYNIHKGYSLPRGLTVFALRDQLRALGSDLVFLQEVQGQSLHRARKTPHWPAAPQYEFLADSLWQEFAYGRNAVYEDGHHGNAILSKFPIVSWDNEDVSQSRLEQRGLLHCEIALPASSQLLHCINVHFGLLPTWRRRQLSLVQNRIERLVPVDAPLILAGDFNDWSYRASEQLARACGLSEVFEATQGQPARSFPARWPWLRLDRIYTRGFDVQAVEVHHGRQSSRLSDHAALATRLMLRA